MAPVGEATPTDEAQDTEHTNENEEDDDEEEQVKVDSVSEFDQSMAMEVSEMGR